MCADDDGNVEVAARRRRAPRKERQMMVGCDADHGAPAIENGEPGERQVAAPAVRVARDDGARRDVRPVLALEETGYRQALEGRIAQRHALHRRPRRRHGRERCRDGLPQAGQDAFDLRAERHCNPSRPFRRFPAARSDVPRICSNRAPGRHPRPTGTPTSRSTGRPACRCAAARLAARARPGTAVWTAQRSRTYHRATFTARILFALAPTDLNRPQETA